MDKLPQAYFEQILNLLIFYKQMNPKKKVTLSEKSIKEATTFFHSADCIPNYPQS
jgi:hypothetical protein